jgi:hypothetical protein
LHIVSPKRVNTHVINSTMVTQASRRKSGTPPRTGHHVWREAITAQIASLEAHQRIAPSGADSGTPSDYGCMIAAALANCVAAEQKGSERTTATS